MKSNSNNPSKPLYYVIHRNQSLTKQPKTVSGYRIQTESWDSDNFTSQWLKKLFHFVTAAYHSNAIAQKKQIHRRQVIDFRSGHKNQKDMKQEFNSWLDAYPSPSYRSDDIDDAKLVKLSRSSVQIVKDFSHVIP